MVDVLGYLSSAIIALSLMMKDIIWLRWLNFLGCALFALYGAMVGAWPVTIANVFVAFVNLYHLWRLQWPVKVINEFSE